MSSTATAGTTATGTRGRRGSSSTSGLLPALGWALFGVVVFVALWALVTSTWVTSDPVITQMGPADALAALPELHERGVLVGDTLASLYRLLMGLAVAALLGIPLGLAVGLSRRTELAGGPVIGILGFALDWISRKALVAR